MVAVNRHGLIPWGGRFIPSPCCVKSGEEEVPLGVISILRQVIGYIRGEVTMVETGGGGSRLLFVLMARFRLGVEGSDDGPWRELVEEGIQDTTAHRQRR